MACELQAFTAVHPPSILPNGTVLGVEDTVIDDASPTPAGDCYCPSGEVYRVGSGDDGNLLCTNGASQSITTDVKAV